MGWLGVPIPNNDYLFYFEFAKPTTFRVRNESILLEFFSDHDMVILRKRPNMTFSTWVEITCIPYKIFLSISNIYHPINTFIPIFNTIIW